MLQNDQNYLKMSQSETERNEITVFCIATIRVIPRRSQSRFGFHKTRRKVYQKMPQDTQKWFFKVKAIYHNTIIFFVILRVITKTSIQNLIKKCWAILRK